MLFVTCAAVRMCSKLYRLPVRRGFDSGSDGHGGRLFCAECGVRSAECEVRSERRRNAAEQQNAATRSDECVPAAFVPAAFISAECVPAECVSVEHTFSAVNSLFGRTRRHRFIRTSPKGCSGRAFRSHRAAMKFRSSLKPSAAYSLFIRRPWEQRPSFW